MRSTTILPLVLAAAITLSHGSTLLVANKTDDTVDLLDADSGRSVRTLPTGGAPHEVAVSRDGRWAVVSNYGDRENPGSSLTVIDVQRGEVVRTVELGRHRRPHGMAWLASKWLVVTTEASAHVVVVDPFEGRLVKEIETGQRVSHMLAVKPGGDRAFVANIGSGSVTVLDLVAGKKLRDLRTGSGAEGIALSPDGREVWISNRAEDTLSVVDTDSLEIRATLACSGFPIRVAFTPDGKHVLVSSARSGEIAVFDAAERKELRRGKLDLSTVPDAASRLFGDRFGESPVPVGLVVAPDGKRAWVAATQADAVVVVDPATLAVRDLWKAGREPDGMAYSAVGPPPGTPGTAPGR